MDLLRETFLAQDAVLQKGSDNTVKPGTSPYGESLGDIAAADADDFDLAIHFCDDSAISQRLSLALDPSVEASNLDSPRYSVNSGRAHQTAVSKPEKRCTRQADGRPFTLALQPDRIQDIKNLWALCQCLRVQAPAIEREGKTRTNLTRLRRCLEFTEDTVRKSASAVHTLSLRIYAVQLAIAYQAYKKTADSQTTARPPNQGTRKRKRKRMVDGKRWHARKYQRDTALDWMTAQLYKDVDITTLAANDQRRVSVGYWLRIGEPLVPLFNHCPALLIAPGMQISQENLIGVKRHERQAFSDRILKAYAPFTDDLTALQFVMYPLLQCINSVSKLRVETLTEAELSHIEEPSFQYWTQFIDYQ